MTPTGDAAFDPRANYRVGDQFVVRRESFGALAYDLSTKKLRVLRDRDLVTVLDRLDGSLSASDAVAAVAPEKSRRLLAALARLEREGMIRVV